MSFKISGQCVLNKHDGIYETEDESLIGSVPFANDALDFMADIKEGNLEQIDEITELPDGIYHVFFIGDVTISGHDYGDGYENEMEVILDQVWTEELKNIS